MPPDFRIRSYRDTDLASVRRLLNALQEAECAMDRSRIHWSDGAGAYTDWMLGESADKEGITVIAEADAGAIIGVMSCWRAEDPTDITVTPEARPHLYVSDLVVAAEWRGRGIAGLLLAEAEKHGRALGLSQMTIGVLAANAAARRAYAKAGFDDYEMLLRKRL